MKEVLSLPYSEYKVLERWVIEEKNKPSKTDYYLMQLTQILHSANSKSSYKVDDFKLEFGIKPAKAKATSHEQKNRAIALAQARWKNRVGLKET